MTGMRRRECPDLDGRPKEVTKGTIPPGISRIAGVPLRQVEVQADGLMLHRLFADATFGGELPALVVARAYREAVLTFVPRAVREGVGREHSG